MRSLMALCLLVHAAPAGAAPPGAVNLPPYEEHVLDSGLRVVIAKRRQLPLVSVELLVETGAADDPPGKAGLSAFTAELLRRGTERRSADEIDQAIEFVGGNLSCDAGADATTVSVSVTSEHLEAALDVVADVATRPSFPKSEFESLKRRTLAELARNLDDPSVVADRAILLGLLPPGHPYALPVNGVKGTVGSFQRGDVVKFHREHFGAARSLLLVVGDVEPAEVLALARKQLGEFRRQVAPRPAIPAPAPLPRNRILIVHKPQATQTQVRFSGVAFPSRTDPAFFPATVANGAFGGGFTSRLMDEIRVNRGLSYGARSRLSHLRGGGFFVFSSFTKNETVGQLLQVALTEAEKVRTQGLTAPELQRAGAYLSGLYPLRLETNEQIASALGELYLFDLPRDWVKDYRRNLQAVTLPEANAAAKRWFFAEPFSVVLVGDRQAIEKGLVEAGLTGDLQVIPIDELE